MATGSVYRRCSCRDDTGRQLGQSCPKLKNKRHGQWAYRIELPADANGNRRPRRRVGFPSAEDAQDQLDQARALLALADGDDTDTRAKIGDVIASAIAAQKPLPAVESVRRLVRAKVDVLEFPTVGQWLSTWLAGKKGIKRNTWRSYESHVRLYLSPHLGNLRIDRLRVAHLDDMFDAITEHNEDITLKRASRDPKIREQVKGQRPVGATSMQRIRATLRKAMNDYIKQTSGAITVNVATLVDLPPAARPKPTLWVPARVAHWRETGQIPSPVMVWTPELTGHFLDHALHDRLYRCSCSSPAVVCAAVRP